MTPKELSLPVLEQMRAENVIPSYLKPDGSPHGADGDEEDDGDPPSPAKDPPKSKTLNLPPVLL